MLALETALLRIPVPGVARLWRRFGTPGVNGNIASRVPVLSIVAANAVALPTLPLPHRTSGANGRAMSEFRTQPVLIVGIVLVAVSSIGHTNVTTVGVIQFTVPRALVTLFVPANTAEAKLMRALLNINGGIIHTVIPPTLVNFSASVSGVEYKRSQTHLPSGTNGMSGSMPRQLPVTLSASVAAVTRAPKVNSLTGGTPGATIKLAIVGNARVNTAVSLSVPIRIRPMTSNASSMRSVL